MKGIAPNNLKDGKKICYENMVMGPLTNTKTLSGHFGYYKTMANNYTLGKEKLNKIYPVKMSVLLIDFCNFLEF